MPHRLLNNLRKGAPAKWKVAVIGVGYLGKFHAQKYAQIPEVELVGVVDRIGERAREWAGRLGTHAYENYRDLIGKVDAVSLVVPTDQHFAIAKEFLEGGSDVLLEKPMAATLREAEGLISTAKGCRRVLQVGHLERFNPAFVAARSRIRSPYFIEVHRLTTFRGRGVEVDVVLDLMIHDLDILLSLVGTEVEDIQAMGVPVLTDQVDIANARLRFKGGVVANVTASRISQEDKRRIRVFQPEAYVSVDFAAKKVVVLRRVQNPEGGKTRIEGESVSVEPGDALENEIRIFLQCSRSKTVPQVTGEDGKRALALALGINEEIRKSIKTIPSTQSFFRNP
jgi:predicted dehydrogenase